MSTHLSAPYKPAEDAMGVTLRPADLLTLSDLLEALRDHKEDEK